MSFSLGRYVYGLAAIGFGICTLVWHDISTWPQLKTFGELPRDVLVYIVAAVEILGGLAILRPDTARIGALALGTVYCIFALLGIPFIIAHPLVYNGFGNFFEQFSLVSGALIVYGRSARNVPARSARLATIGYYAFAVCLVSFALEQLFYLKATASLVPQWIPPGQTFWALATTALFALAGIALLTGFVSRLASRLTTAMLVGFALLVWVPALFAGPRSFENWSEAVETLAIAGSAWIAAEFRA